MKKIKIIFLVFIIWEIFSLYYIYYEGVYLGKQFPSNTFLYDPHDAFNDYYNLFAYADPLQSGSFHYGNYLPFIYNFFNIVRFLNIQNITFIFLIVILIGSTFYFLFINLKSIDTSNNSHLEIITFSFVISFLSYPILFVIDRGNIEIIVYLLVMLYILLEKKKNNLSSLFLSIAIAIKIFPAAFLLVSLNKRRYKVIFLTLLGAAFFIFIGFLTYKGGNTIHDKILNLQKGMDDYKILAMDHYNFTEGINFNHSFFSILRYLDFLGLKIDLIKMRNYYYIIISIITLLITVFVYKCKMDFWKVVTLSMAIVCFFPIISADYKLLYTLLPLPYFIADTEERNKKYLFFCILWGLILAPKHLIWNIFPISINFFINALCLMTFLLSLIIGELNDNNIKLKYFNDWKSKFFRKQYP